MSNTTSMAPWLTVADGNKALAFYKAAFGAKEVYRLDVPGTVVARLSVDGGEFWVSEEPGENAPALGGGNIRMIISTNDPDGAFNRAVAAGAKVVYSVGESHGWRIGRIEDPFGLHWEIGKQL